MEKKGTLHVECPSLQLAIIAALLPCRSIDEHMMMPTLGN